MNNICLVTTTIRKYWSYFLLIPCTSRSTLSQNQILNQSKFFKVFSNLIINMNSQKKKKNLNIKMEFTLEIFLIKAHKFT
jgi:hypothetical protein